ncbi:MAG: hypothetical protein WKF89_04755 [Chitinophagaceae bacterium]
MKKFFLASILVITTLILFNVRASYGNGSHQAVSYSAKKDLQASIFQDTTHKKAVPTKKAEVDRTKGESGQGQGKGTDTIPVGTGSGKQAQDSVLNKGTQNKNEQNSDDRGEGTHKNNRAGSTKRGVDTLRQ